METTKYYRFEQTDTTYRIKNGFLQFWSEGGGYWMGSMNPSGMTKDMDNFTPELTHCPDCANQGCYKCEQQPFSVWRLFNDRK